MKVTREQAAENRERILDAAAKLFRRHGLDGIGVADLMKDAGLTHGGFYGHFASKEELMAQALARALGRSVQKWQERTLPELTQSYLSTRHRDNPGGGCAIATLGNDVSRQGAPVRRAFTDGVRALVDVLAGLLPGRNAVARRRKALATYSAMVGALVLARAVDDPRLSGEILDAVSSAIDGKPRHDRARLARGL
jgi:TetR/AcrR family transcriptional regulator, transcriptional repressor for nem operon